MAILYSAQHGNQHNDAFELFTVTHFVKNPAWQFCDLICRVYQSVNDVRVCYLQFSETEKTTPLFKQHTTKAINQ